MSRSASVECYERILHLEIVVGNRKSSLELTRYMSTCLSRLYKRAMPYSQPSFASVDLQSSRLQAVRHKLLPSGHAMRWSRAMAFTITASAAGEWGTVRIHVRAVAACKRCVAGGTVVST